MIKGILFFIVLFVIIYIIGMIVGAVGCLRDGSMIWEDGCFKFKDANGIYVAASTLRRQAAAEAKIPYTAAERKVIDEKYHEANSNKAMLFGILALVFIVIAAAGKNAQFGLVGLIFVGFSLLYDYQVLFGAFLFYLLLPTLVLYLLYNMFFSKC